jgi:hypothetical protein
MPSKAVGENGLRTITQRKKSEPLSLTYSPSFRDASKISLSQPTDIALTLAMAARIYTSRKELGSNE